MHSSPRTYVADYIRSISNEGFSNADVSWASDWVRRGAFADSGGVSGTEAEVDNIEGRKKRIVASGFSSRAERKAFRRAMDETETKFTEKLRQTPTPPRNIGEVEATRARLDAESKAYIKSLEEASAAKTRALEDEVAALVRRSFIGTDIYRVEEYRVVRIASKVFRIVVTTGRSFNRYQFDLKNITQEHFREDVIRELREIVDLFTEG